MNKKAQTSMEFIIIIGAVMFGFLGLLFVMQENSAQQTRDRRNQALEDIALNIQREIELANNAKEGYERTFKVPLDVYGKSIAVAIVTKNTIYVHTTDGKNALSLPVQEVEGSINLGSNTIKKLNGIVCFSPSLACP